MKFMIVVKATPDSEAGRWPEDSEKLFQLMASYHEELAKAGALLDASGLHPSSKGWRIRYEGDKRRVIDGPFAETKELIAGYTIIQVRNRDEAIRNSMLGIEAIHGGKRSPAWKAYMMQFVDQDPLGKPVDERQLARLLATDGTDGDLEMDRHRAYLVGSSTCGPDTPQALHATVNSIDDRIGHDLRGCMTDDELNAAVGDPKPPKKRPGRY